MEGIERLEAEVLEMNNSSISAIFEYLKTRTDLYEYFNNKEKSIHQMYKFICDKARKQKINNVAIISDRMVFLWASIYFSKSNEELGLKGEQKVMPPSDNEEIKNMEKKQAKQEEKASKENKTQDNQFNLFTEV